jgi:hypothetical protein
VIKWYIIGKALKDVAVYAAIGASAAAAVLTVWAIFVYFANKFGVVVFPIAIAMFFLGMGITTRYQHHNHLDQESKKKMMDVLTR